MTNDMKQGRTFKQGEIIFAEGDPPGSLYIIEAGMVEISRGSGEEKVVLAERSANDVLGEMALVDNQPRSATAKALTDVQVIEIGEEQFSRYIRELNPLIYHVFRSLVTTIRHMNETQALVANILTLRGRSS